MRYVIESFWGGGAAAAAGGATAAGGVGAIGGVGPSGGAGAVGAPGALATVGTAQRCFFFLFFSSSEGVFRFCTLGERCVVVLDAVLVLVPVPEGTPVPAAAAAGCLFFFFCFSFCFSVGVCGFPDPFLFSNAPLLDRCVVGLDVRVPPDPNDRSRTVVLVVGTDAAAAVVGADADPWWQSKHMMLCI